MFPVSLKHNKQHLGSERYLDFYILIQKGNSKEGLFIECYTHNSTVNVNQIHYADDVHQYAQNYLAGNPMDSYQGPEFRVLDDRLQQEFISLLSQLGISDDLGSLLEVISVDKDHKDYVNWLKTVGTNFNVQHKNKITQT